MNGLAAAQAQEADMEAQNNGEQPLGPLNEYNITNYMVDASSDWLFKQEGVKYSMAG